MDKKQLRAHMNAQRTSLPPELRKKYAQQAAQHLKTHSIFLNSQRIACYVARGSEMDTTAIIEAIWAMNKHCYLPAIHPQQFGAMSFVEYQSNDPLKEDRFGIKEPLQTPDKIIAATQLDLVILPLFAFDLKGNRLGTGGGYYDRAFSFMTQQTQLKKPILCGLAYECQKIDRLDHDEWDVPLQFVVTEKQIIKLTYAQQPL